MDAIRMNEKDERKNNSHTYQGVEILGIDGLFSNERIIDDDVPKGLYRYDLRGSDDDSGIPVTLEKHVIVNHVGTVLTAKPLDIPDEGYIRLTEDNGMNFIGSEVTL